MKILRKNIGPLIVFLIFFLSGLIIALAFPKLEIQRFTNSFYHPIGNSIFQFLSHLVEGWFTIPLLVYLLFKNWRQFIFILVIYGVSALFAGVIKYFLWFIERPYGVLELKESLTYKWVPGLDLHTVRSFPSGHTTTAFCLLFGLSLIIKNKKTGVALMVLACFIGLSRTYLSLHFLMDLIAGAFLGVATAMGMYYALYKKLRI